jgi:outer membrane lipoprotein-sorting protein
MKKDNIISRLQDEISKYKDVNYDFLQEIEDLNKNKLNCDEL